MKSDAYAYSGSDSVLIFSLSIRGVMARAIFISYRRDDTEGEAGRLFDDLTRSFGENSVFMDVDGINPGMDFRRAIDDNVSSCGVLLAMIGPTWSTIKNAAGSRRLDDANDFVRLEIAAALGRNIAVIPVLVHEAVMPRHEELPDNLKDLAYRNSVEITHARWNSDVQLLINALGKYVAPSAATETKPVHATVPVQLPPPSAPASASVRASPASRPTSVPLVLGVIAAAVVALGFVGFLVLKPHPKPDPLSGTWTNPAPEPNNGIDKLEIMASANQVNLHAWGKCSPADCDWGTQMAQNTGAEVKATWSFVQQSGNEERGRVANVSLRPDNGSLKVHVFHTYAHRPATERDYEFIRAQ